LPLFNLKNVGWTGILGVVGEAPEFASLYEAFNPLTTLAKTHFVEWFSGKDIDTIWNTVETGSGSGAMDDAIDGGYKLTTGAVINNNRNINFNTIKHYSQTASIIISVTKLTNLVNALEQDGFIETIAFAHYVLSNNDSAATPNYELISKDGTTPSAQQGSIARDTNFHVKKITLTPSNLLLDIDGTLDVTKTTNRPAARLQPIFRVFTRGGAARTGHIRYLEAYST